MCRICHKADSAVVLKAMYKYFPSEYHFFPQSWSLPKETAALHAFMQERDGAPAPAPAPAGGTMGARPKSGRRARSSGPPKYILKPSKGCQGADIRIISSPPELDEARQALGPTTGCVVQQYVDRPLLLNGYKFDLRLYVLVTSCVPLRIHLYRDGIARLCMMKYNEPVATTSVAASAPASAPAPAPSLAPPTSPNSPTAPNNNGCACAGVCNGSINKNYLWCSSSGGCSYQDAYDATKGTDWCLFKGTVPNSTCSPGLTLQTSDDTCVPCAKGTFKTTTSNDACTDCAEGYTTIDTGNDALSACIVCDSGWYSATGNGTGGNEGCTAPTPSAN